ncbi:MAG: hypothetical protein ABJB78_07535, partial [Betaproteobacteria bacterium]
MTRDQIEQVFGRGRLKMATGDHVEVFREAMAPGERRRYTKRFLATNDGDFGPWTEREWRILARLIGHGVRCVPDVVQFDGGAMGGARLVQTYDAGITVDQWGTLLPVARKEQVHRHVFEDCAHWWALAHHCLAALDAIHAIGLVHLDVKGDNICIPCTPADFDPAAPAHRLHPQFAHLALIDFAFSLVSRESLAMPLPIGWQKDYDYQSPRLLRALDAGRGGDLEPTQELDWRCDMYSLAAMLKRYLPEDRSADQAGASGWTPRHYDDARTLIFRLRDCHDRDLAHWRPHPQFMDFTAARLESRELAVSLGDGWMLARDTTTACVATPMTPITPMTRMAAATIRTIVHTRTMAPPPRVARQRAQRTAPFAAERVTRTASPSAAPTVVTVIRSGRAGAPSRESREVAFAAPQRAPRRASRRVLPAAVAVAAVTAFAAPSFIGDPQHSLASHARELLAGLRWPLRAPLPDSAREAVEPPPASASQGADSRAMVAQEAGTEPETVARLAALNTPQEDAVAPARRNDAARNSTSVNEVPAAPSPIPRAASAAAVPTNATAQPVAEQPVAAHSKTSTSKRSPQTVVKPPSAPAKTYAEAKRRPVLASAATERARAIPTPVPSPIATPSPMRIAVDANATPKVAAAGLATPAG